RNRGGPGRCDNIIWTGFWAYLRPHDRRGGLLLWMERVRTARRWIDHRPIGAHCRNRWPRVLVGRRPRSEDLRPHTPRRGVLLGRPARAPKRHEFRRARGWRLSRLRPHHGRRGVLLGWDLLRS